MEKQNSVNLTSESELNSISLENNKADSISQETSKRITALRFLLIIFIVFIHNNITYEDAVNYYHIAFNEPIVITWFKLLVRSVLGGAAVPLFFLFSGYLQFSKKNNYICLLKKRTKSLFIPYIIWTLLNVLLFYIAQSIPQLTVFFQNENNIVRNFKTLDWINLFWQHSNSCPFVYQFWFLRNLIILVLFSPVLTYVAKKFPFLSLVGITIGYINGLPLAFDKAIFFYMAGWYFAEYKISFFKIADKIKWMEYLVLLVLILIANINNYDIFGIGTIISCLFFLKISKLIIEKEKLFSIANYLSGFSFFLYAIHTPFLGTSLNKISWKIIPLHGVWCLVQFIIPCLLCIIIGTGIGILLKKYIPSVFKILNGSR